MNNELLNTRFFTTDDKRMDKVVFPLPLHWWSRFYEYAWAAEFCKETDVVLDAACGIAHPFKFYLPHKCKTVHAIDIDERILDFSLISAEIKNIFGQDINPEFLEMNSDYPILKHGSITELPYKNNMFDKIFCLSVLEHLSEGDIQTALTEFRRVLKNNGTVILTLDYPTIAMITIKDFAEYTGFKLAGEIIPALTPNSINWNNQLYCFRMVLVKSK